MKKLWSLFSILISKIKETEKKRIISVTFIMMCTFAIGIYACFTPADNVINEKVEVSASTKTKEETTVEVVEQAPQLPKQDQQVQEQAMPVELLQEETIQENEPPQAEKQEIVKGIQDNYTCLLTVPDKGGARTDMIMLLVFRPNEKEIDLVSIPRDTKVEGKKINAVAIKKGKLDIDLLTSKVENLTGIDIDTYMFVDIECVKRTVDLFGGVMFDVKQNMYYQDPYQNLYISLQKGKQLITGNKAEQLLRYRKYADGDIGRTRIQREFMIEAFKQHAKLENLPKIPEWFKMAEGHIKTNMTEEGMLSIAQTVINGPFKVNSMVMPFSLSEGFVICNKNEMAKMAKELGY